MNINDDNIGKFFQESLKDMEVKPDAAVWTAVKQQSGISSGFSALSKLAILGFAAVAIVSSYMLFLNNDNNKSEDIAETISAPVQSVNPSTPTAEAVEINVDSSDSNETLVLKSNPKKNTILKQQKQSVVSVKKERKEDSLVKKQQPKQKKNMIVKRDTSGEIELTPEQELYQSHLINFSQDTVLAKVKEEVLPEEVLAVETQDSAHIEYSENPTICFGEDAILQVKGGLSYIWNTGANTSKIKVSPVEQSDYWVVITDEFGNQIKHIFTVYIDRECTAIFVPSAFTPNSDGVNDMFKAEGIGVQSFKMIIFNREGQIVYESSNIDDPWDGTYRGSRLSSRAYFYKITYVDAKGVAHNKQGQVTLIR